MKSILRIFFLIAAIVAFIPAAQAQIDCGQCDPYSSGCDSPCIFCIIDTMDQGCQLWEETTCGAGGRPCLTCAPNYQETGRSNVGTYGEATWWYWAPACNHHRVDLVTQTDSNQCNTDSTYWTRTFCDDWVDWWKQGTSYTDYQDCCDGWCGPGVPCSFMTCNHYHSCYSEKS